MPRSENVRGDINDVIRVARQGLNRSNASRIISKQECMVELTGLPLVLCSEDIENINISGAMKLQNRVQNDQSRTLIKQYQNRPNELEQLSFCEFVHHENKAKNKTRTIIPHFIGMTSTPTYPPTVSYARATLIIHSPWRSAKFHKLSDSECLSQFDFNIRNNIFPRSVILTYHKIKAQYLEHRLYNEPTQNYEPNENGEEILTNEEEQLIRAMTSFNTSANLTVIINGMEYNRGISYDWSKPTKYVSPKHTKCINQTSTRLLTATNNYIPKPPDSEDKHHLWLCKTIEAFQMRYDINAEDGKIHLPMKNDGTTYSLEEAKQEQRQILFHVFDTLRKWIDKHPNYKPLHRIVSGGGGTGKSYLIHQITTVIRKMFGRNDTVETAAFTGSAAYNIGGKTIHSGSWGKTLFFRVTF